LTSDGLTVDGDGLFNGGFNDPKTITLNSLRSVQDNILGKILFQNTSNDVAEIYANSGPDGTNRDEGKLIFRTAEAGGTMRSRMLIDYNGDISFYEDTGTTAKFFWDASAELLKLGSLATTGTFPLMVKSNANHHAIHIEEASGNEGYTLGVDADGDLGFYNSGGATASVTFDDSGNVGIGTDSPGLKFVVANGADAEISTQIFGADTTSEYLGFGQNGSNSVITAGSAGAQSVNLVFRTASSGSETERMRITSAGDLLVGTTTVTGEGISIRGGVANYIYASRNGAESAYFDRLTSDGKIVEFRKDGTTVGSIGVGQSSDLYIGTSDTGILTSSSESITPWNPSTNVGRDDAIDLGTSDHRFQDLYLSGGVYLGGTGSANKLDDYEEGTWTPSYPSGWTGEAQYANYTKVGRFCYYNAKILVNNTSSGNFSVGGLPFTNGVYAKTHGAQMFEQVTLSTNRTQVVAFTSGNSNSHELYQLHSANSAWSGLTSSNINSNSEFYIQGVIVTA
jgi:hypothetical protein